MPTATFNPENASTLQPAATNTQKSFILRKWLILGLAAIVLLAAAAFGLMCLSTAEVVDRGELLPYVKGYTIYKVRVLDRYEFFVEPDVKPSGDLFNGYVLVGIAFMSLTFAVVMKVVSAAPPGKTFWLFVCMFFGASYLAADEVLGIHETLGHNMQFLTTIVPIAERPDDAIIMFYGIPALLFVVYFYRTLLASKAAIVCFIAALAMFALGAVSDGLTLPIEEFCEMISSICLIAGVVALGIHHIKTWSLPGTSAA